MPTQITKSKTTHSSVRTADICMHKIMNNCRTQQHTTVLIIVPLNIQTS